MAKDIQHTDPADILVIGGGIAGSLLALAASRAGHGVTVVDPKRDPAPVFRNEKLGVAQSLLLNKLGALHCFEEALWPPEGDPHAYPAERRPGLTDCGAPHQAWLASVRRAWGPGVRFVESTVATLETSSCLQHAVTTEGEAFAARLAVLATGRMPGLRQALGVEARTISEGHSVCLGFSVAFDRAVAAEVVDAPPGSGVGYVSLFPMPGETRINVFSYRPLADPWTRRMSADPIGCLAALDPRLERLLSGARLMRRCEARGTDLYEVSGHRQPGLVLIGDAFHAPCPASGTGMLRILNDIDILTGRFLPRWFETPGMDRDKICAFYDDAEKRRLDTASIRSSLRGRHAVVGKSPYWRGRRLLGNLKRTLGHRAEG